MDELLKRDGVSLEPATATPEEVAAQVAGLSALIDRVTALDGGTLHIGNDDPPDDAFSATNGNLYINPNGKFYYKVDGHWSFLFQVQIV